MDPSCTSICFSRTSMNNTTAIDAEDNYSNRYWTVPYLLILLVVGTIGNTCGLALFFHSSMRKYSCSLYFFLLSLFDEVYLAAWIINWLSRELTIIEIRDRSTLLCKLYVVIFYTSSQASNGMLVLTTIDRLLTSRKIAHGYFDVRLVTRRQQTQHTSLAIFFFALMGLNAILFGSQLETRPGDKYEYCVVIDRDINRIYSLIDLCIYALIPCICMFVGDILILYYLKRTRSRMISSHAKNKRHERQLSFMIVISSVISLLIISPYSLLSLLTNFSNILRDDYRTMRTLNDAFGLLSTLTHAMHFYIFLIISGTIRRHFKLLLTKCWNECATITNVIHPIGLPTNKAVTVSWLTMNQVKDPPYSPTSWSKDRMNSVLSLEHDCVKL